MNYKAHTNLKTCISSSDTDKAWANSKLRFAIATLQGKIESGIWKRRLQTALTIKDQLLEAGYVWQARVLEAWIHRLQPIKADSERAEGAH